MHTRVTSELRFAIRVRGSRSEIRSMPTIDYRMYIALRVTIHFVLPLLNHIIDR
jgi:hypothetical protein